MPLPLFPPVLARLTHHVLTTLASAVAPAPGTLAPAASTAPRGEPGDAPPLAPAAHHARPAAGSPPPPITLAIVHGDGYGAASSLGSEGWAPVERTGAQRVALRPGLSAAAAALAPAPAPDAAPHHAGPVFAENGLVIPLLARGVYWHAALREDGRPYIFSVKHDHTVHTYRPLPVGEDWRAIEATVRARLDEDDPPVTLASRVAMTAGRAD